VLGGRRKRKRTRSRLRRRDRREYEVSVQGVNVHNRKVRERVTRTTVTIEEIDQSRRSTASGRRGAREANIERV